MDLEPLIEQAILAPSGDNSQPWSFKVAADAVDIIAHPETDHGLFNVEGRGTYLAIGALIENLCIAGENSGIQGTVSYAPDTSVAAHVRFVQAKKILHPLFEAIRKRVTHRGPYETSIDSELINRLLSLSDDSCQIHAIADPDDIKRISEAAAVMEEVALRVKKIHALFFKSILWYEQKNQAGMPGLYIRTLELPRPVQWLFRAIQYWNVMRVMNMMGFSKLAAKGNAAIYAQSGAMLIVTVSRTSSESFMRAGRLFERAWLTCTEAGLSGQPLAGLPYLALYLEKHADPDIPADLQTKVRKAQHVIQGYVDPRDSIAVLLRIGKEKKPPTARSRRHAPDYL